jgi:hypothetical protein
MSSNVTLRGRPDLVLTGFMTHMCVNSTARDAFNLGYRPTVVASTTATRELSVPGGTPVPDATLQAATLAGFSDLFAVVAGPPEYIPVKAARPGPRWPLAIAVGVRLETGA